MDGAPDKENGHISGGEQGRPWKAQHKPCANGGDATIHYEMGVGGGNQNRKKAKTGLCFASCCSAVYT